MQSRERRDGHAALVLLLEDQSVLPDLETQPLGEEVDDGDADADSVLATWDAIKAAEKAARGDTSSPFDSVPRSSGSLSFAAGVLKKADKNGIEIDIGPGPELSDVTDVGEHLLAVVAECRRRGIDPEVALREVVNQHIR